MPAPAVVTRGLTRLFGTTRAVEGLDLEVPAGAILGFLGPNGAGKTTTFNLLCGFLRPTSGQATVLGEPLSRVSHLRGRFTALPQDARFQPTRNLLDSLRFLGELQGLDRVGARREADRVLQAVGLSEAAHTRGSALSHGMAKRFGIAQAFLGTPELVLLDEPTEGLDPRQAHSVRGMIRALVGHATVLVSSHNLPAIEDICTHVAIIDKGRLVASGTLEEIRRGKTLEERFLELT